MSLYKRIDEEILYLSSLKKVLGPCVTVGKTIKILRELKGKIEDE